MRKKIHILAAVLILAAVSLFNPVTARAEIGSGTCGTCNWTIDDDGTLTISPADGTSGTLASIARQSRWPWYSNGLKVKKVVIEEGVAAGTEAAGMFYGMSNCTDFQVSSFDTSAVTNMSQMFYNCTALANMSGLAEWDTSNVTNMYCMFSGCKSLADISGLVGWNTGSVTNMNSMFANCNSLADTSSFADWDTGSVTSMNSMFKGCTSLSDTSGLADWNTGSVTNMSYMFSNCTSLADTSGLADWNTGSVTNMSCMFSGCASLVDTSGLTDWDTGNVTNMGSMFGNCTSLADTSGLADWDTGSVTNMSNMFFNCTSLADTSGLADWDTGSVTNMSCMFFNCKSLADTSGLADWDTGKVTNMSGMFSGCKSLADISGLVGWNTGSVTDMSNMFYGCTSLADTSGLADWNTGSVTSMSYMFSDCKSLADASGLTSWNTGNVTDMNYMFCGCTSLTDISGLSSWNTSKVTDMSYMFKNCTSLEELDISGWDTSKVTTFSNMFANDNRLKKVNLGENVKFRGNGATSRNRLTLPTPPSNQDGIRYTGKWIREDGSYGPFTPAQMITNYTPEMAGWWVWEEVPVSYSITYAAPEEAAGSMAGEKPKAAESHEIPKCGYVLFANRFDHWVDGRGNSYPDRGIIPANRYSAGDQITLTAVFVPIDTKVNMEDGTFEVTLRAGEKAKFDGIPAGTAYQVFEETPDGWLLVGQVNSSGQIEPLKEAKASFINRYQPDITSVQFSGSKTLDSRPAEEGSYTFQLIENGVVIQEKTILPGGFIQFDPITYERGDVGEHVYTIKEVDSGDESIEHDPHEETITVTVTDNGDGTLSSAASYDADGIIFANRVRPGSLRIGKTADGATDANEEDTFRFRITFRNENGQPVDKDIYWYVEEDGVPVSDTQTAVP